MTATFSAMGFNTQFQGNQCIDPADMDNFVDFGTMPSPTPSGSNSKAPMSRSASTMTSPTNTIVPLDFNEEQAPIKPSHEYSRFKQQTGLPTGSYQSLTGLPQEFDGFSNSGLDLGIGSSSMFNGMGSNSGLGIDDSMNFEMTSSNGLPAFFYPNRPSDTDDFIDPSAISQEEQPQPNVRFYPGMHQQQAALAKAQQQAQQQRQQIIQQQQKQHGSEQPTRNQSTRKSVTPIDARTEETIARVVNQIRQNSSFASESGSPPSSAHHMSRSRKDEEDMDEDERLLASEEGKKLSSKERRQLRNKVSARAFRSRRKEYITQLEGEVAIKVNEANELKNENRALIEENARFRELTVKLLRHPAFTPFLEDISRDPALSDSLSKVTSSMSASTSAEPTPSNKHVNSFSAPSQQMLDAPQNSDLHIGMATIPETQLDFSALNINGNNNWTMPGMNGFGFQQPQVFAVLEVPEGPAELLDAKALAGKGEESLIERFTPVEDAKEDYPVIETPTESEPKAVETIVDESVEFDESDPAFALYADIPVQTSSTAAPKEESFVPILGHITPEKAFARFELVLSDGSDAAALEERLAFLCARAERSFQHLQAMSAQFE
ncbi:hypothetical protein NA57DRAFT_51160 [Rhizodiscina lignyota]|uniref:BZIP domain-containing protein n=1 Tax=Rhizodiscina lignyota TaxID=1504668 RepID=A0A9P4ITS2_9PEZI|nr:hypothetical protein NA57DRAFT_51160 [Rhizodiscina lignyota]